MSKYDQPPLLGDDNPGKICSKCKKLKPYGEFYRRSDRPSGIHSRCKECSNADHARYMQENSEKMLAYQRKYLKEHPEKTRQHNLKAKFGLTQADYDELLAKQGNVCAGCGTDIPGGKKNLYFHFDHDHSCCPGIKTCGECIRGLLCSRCNCALGLVDDNPNLLRRLADYVEKARANRN